MMRRLVECCGAGELTSSYPSAGVAGGGVIAAGSTMGRRLPPFSRSNSVSGISPDVGSTEPTTPYQRRGYTTRLLTRRLTVSSPDLTVIGRSLPNVYCALIVALTSLVSVTV